MQKFILSLTLPFLLMACSATKKNVEESASSEQSTTTPKVVFDSDSAFHYLKTQVGFGPRINNTESHRKTCEWLQSELQRHGAKVVLQPMTLQSFDGVMLNAVNIIGQYNPEASERLLLLAHYDTRPWADSDADAKNHKTPVPGANDGASGVAVLLETARLLGAKNPGKGIDILFVDAEDRGSHEIEDSWALGAKYFATHPFVEGYSPKEAILLDMVGGRGARFRMEYFSMQGAPQLLQTIWAIAAESGYGDFFIQEPGGAVTDDHVPLLEQGIPAIDIIEFDPESENGFNKTWHTIKDDVENIDPATLKAVGQTLINYIYR